MCAWLGSFLIPSILRLSPHLPKHTAIREGRLPNVQVLNLHVEDDQVQEVADAILAGQVPLLRKCMNPGGHKRGIALSTFLNLLQTLPFGSLSSYDFPLRSIEATVGEVEEKTEKEDSDKDVLGTPLMLEKFARGLLDCSSIKILELSPGAFSALVLGVKER